MRQCTRLFFLVGLVLGTLSAQVDRTTITGRVTDPSGAVVVGARVIVTDQGTSLQRETTSGADGSYVITALPASVYQLVVSSKGFRDLQIADILQTVGSTRTLNARLELAATSQTTEVTASGAAVDATTATLGETVERIQAEKIPLNGRNWATLTSVVPGAVDLGDGNQKSIRFDGHGTDDTNFRLDGVDFTGIQNEVPHSINRLQISEEAIQEFSVTTGAYTVENGGTAGGQVNIVSRSGTNAFHGSAFEYLRNSAMDARNPFNHAPSPQPPFRLNQFGGSLGGAIRKNRTFFFSTYEGFRQSLGITQVGLVPSPSLRASIIAANPALTAVMNAYPVGTTQVPNLSSALQGEVLEYVGATSSPVREDAGFFRIDHRFTDRDTFYVRYNVDVGFTQTPVGALNQVTWGAPAEHNAILEYLHIFSPTTLNEVRIGFNRVFYNAIRNGWQAGLPYAVIAPNLSEIYDYYPQVRASNSFSGRDDASWVVGVHTLKAGIEIRRVQQNEGNGPEYTYSFASAGADGFSNLRTNSVNTFKFAGTLPMKGLRKTQYGAYIQDEWKLAPSLTLTYGVRYNFFEPFSEVANRAYQFDLEECGGFCKRGGLFTNPNYKDFDPRVSLAWAPAALHNATVFRAGYGIYRGEIQLGDQDAAAVNDQPALNLQSSSTLQLSYPIDQALIDQALIATGGLAATPRSMARHHPDSYIQDWTASIQQLLPAEIEMTVAYIGSKGTNLFLRTYVNTLNPVTGVAPLAPKFPSEIDVKHTSGQSTSNALQVSAKRHLTKGVFMAASYQWAHEIDDASTGGGDADTPENVACQRCERASGDYDVRQTGTLSMVYQLPFGRNRKFLSQGRVLNLFFGGWEVNELFRARSGLPLNVIITRSGTTVPDGNTASQRPDIVPGVSIYPAHQDPSDWLNLAAFTTPKPGTFGNAPRNVARGPNFWQDDLALDKDIALREGLRLNLRAEAFNVFNRAQYGSPSINISSPASFGLITTLVNAGMTGSGTPRDLQVALRLFF